MTLILSGTDGLSDVDGSAATPAIRGTDANTGIFFPAADTIAFSEGGAEAMRIDSSGNVGIGTASPKTGLSLLKFGTQWTNNTTNSYPVPAGKTFLQVEAQASEENWFGFTGSYGATSGSANLLLQANFNNTNQQAGHYIGSQATAASSAVLTFGAMIGGSTTGGNSTKSEHMRIDSSGNLLVGTTTASGSTSTFKSTSAGQQSCAFWNNATSGTRYFVSFATEATSTDRGYITYNGTTVAIAQASDARLKENIVDAPSALPKIAALQIRSFDFKEDGRHVDYGVIAQELESVIPSAVFKGSETEDGEMDKPWSVGLEPIIPVLVKAIQELKALVDTQASTITQLQADVAALKGTA